MFHMDVGEGGKNVGHIIEQLTFLHKLGFTTAIGGVANVSTIEPLEIIAREVIPAIRDL
jgi:hypothetical protein